MDWKAKAGRERDKLKRVAARLLALADLAERAAGRSWPVRWLVLWFLSQADATVRDFVARSASKAPGGYRPPVLESGCYGHGPADAFNLAVSLRSLAWIVRAMAAHVRPSSFLQSGRASVADDRDRGPHHDAFRRFLGAAFPLPERLDTS